MAMIPKSSIPVREGDLGPSVVIVGAVSLGVTTIALALRLGLRALSPGETVFWWDDWALVLTTIISHAFLSLNIAWTHLGLGKHIEAISVSNTLPSVYFSKASMQLYSLCIWLIKISALLLYARIFKITRRFRIALWCVGGWVTAWFVCTAIVPWFNCSPVRKTIDPFILGQCFDRMGWFLASAFINAITDLIILILPIPVVWQLQMTLRRKISVIFVFLLGYCSCFLSFARFVIIIRDPTVMSVVPAEDPYYHTIPLLLLSMLEAPFAIVALSAPTIVKSSLHTFAHGKFKSLFRNVFRSEGGRKSTGSRRKYESNDNIRMMASDISGNDRSSRAMYYEGVPCTYHYKDAAKDPQGVLLFQESRLPTAGSYTSITALASSRHSPESDEFAVPLGPMGVVRDDGTQSRWTK
ncbi:hypothetical protein F4810DRAFT_627735 [Camillea tinctor]|nr:hypothetical protein F4810DRAFT_627735 [Camillea tinctor]